MLSTPTRHRSNQKDKFLFDVDDYKFIRKIKDGGFAVVNLVKHKTSGEYYAAKTNFIQNSKQNKLHISREIRILIEVQHPTIIQFRGISYIDFNKLNNITILMDYMKNGSLADLIYNESKGLLTMDYDDTKRQSILVGIARGMMILHKHHIIHRDLKPENIIIDDEYHPHITDFGLSKFFDPQNSKKQSCSDTGTLAYMAPEVIKSDKFNAKADVYAFGIIMYEVLNGKRAYQNFLNGEYSKYEFQNRVVGGMRPEIKEGSMKKGFQLMIKKCWSHNPSERPTFSELYKKLSLIEEDSILDFEENYGEEVINCDEDDEEVQDGIRKTFCLPAVDLELFFDYIDEISIDAKSLNNPSVDSEEIEKLKQEVDQLKSKAERQELTISSLNSELEKVKNKNKKLTNDNEKFKKKFDQINSQFIEMSILPEKYRGTEDNDDDDDNFSEPKQGIVRNLFEKVVITHGGNASPTYPIANIFYYDRKFFFNSYNFEPSSENDSFIKFDFGEKTKVDLHSYFMRSNDGDELDCHPKSWRIDGSNDNVSWKIIDKHSNEESLHGRYKQNLFKCC